MHPIWKYIHAIETETMEKLPNNFDFIAIEGVIGAGKTTLAKSLGERRQARLVLEEFEGNPFLPKFYENRERYAFQTQLSFLASRFQQQQALKSQDLFQSLTISDYIFDKDRIFARINLPEDELALYDRIFKIMSDIAPTPDLVVYLQSNIDRLLYNIQKRDRSYEHHITREYLQELSEAYNHFFYYFNDSPVIIINATELDFVTYENQLDTIEEQIFNRPIRGKTHLNIRPK